MKNAHIYRIIINELNNIQISRWEYHFFIYIFPNGLRWQYVINYGVGTWHLCSEYHKKYFIYMHNARIMYTSIICVYYITSRFDIFIYTLFFFTQFIRGVFSLIGIVRFLRLTNKKKKNHKYFSNGAFYNAYIKSVWAYIAYNWNRFIVYTSFSVFP